MGGERGHEKLASGIQGGKHLLLPSGQEIQRLVLYSVGLALLFIVRAVKYENSADFSPVLLLGALGWFVVLALSLLPGMGSTEAQARAAMSRTILFGGMSGLLLWACLRVGGSSGPTGILDNILVLLEFAVGYAMLGLLIALPSVLSKRRQ